VAAVQIALLTASAVHLGFQATVTAVAYPALARVPEAQWAAAHQAHSRAITPVVVVVYGSLVVANGATLWRAPGVWTWMSAGAAAVAMGVTALVAAPAHGRLGQGYDAARIRRLLRADRVRAVAAAAALLAAIFAVA
jgi:hypothetical protein